jgi:predicted ATPase
MLNRVHIENFKCLRDVTVELSPFTALIGPNDSGKSSFLDALQTLGRLVTEPISSVFSGDREFGNLVWRKNVQQSIKLEASGKIDNEPYLYCLEFSGAARPLIESLKVGDSVLLSTSGNQMRIGQQTHQAVQGTTTLFVVAQSQQVQVQPIARKIASSLRASQEYHFDPAQMVKVSIPQADEILKPSGENLSGFLDSLNSGADRSAFEAIERDLHEAVPTLLRISLPPAKDRSGAKRLEFVLSGSNGKPTIPASLASNGALLLTAYLALAHSATTEILLIEEPENGLHPERLQLVVDLLRKMTTGQKGSRPRQVIITTHSPLLLNCVAADEVRVFSPDASHGTQVRRMDQAPDIKKLLKEFGTGELWYLLGEEKLFKGQPA